MTRLSMCTTVDDGMDDGLDEGLDDGLDGLDGMIG
jgi:hypothetical protein